MLLFLILFNIVIFLANSFLNVLTTEIFRQQGDNIWIRRDLGVWGCWWNWKRGLVWLRGVFKILSCFRFSHFFKIRVCVTNYFNYRLESRSIPRIISFSPIDFGRVVKRLPECFSQTSDRSSRMSIILSESGKILDRFLLDFSI